MDEVVVVLNEVVDLAKMSKRGCLFFKMDFRKAYDSANLSLLDYMLRTFGFDDHCRS